MPSFRTIPMKMPPNPSKNPPIPPKLPLFICQTRSALCYDYLVCRTSCLTLLIRRPNQVDSGFDYGVRDCGSRHNCHWDRYARARARWEWRWELDCRSRSRILLGSCFLADLCLVLLQSLNFGLCLLSASLVFVDLLLK